MNSINPKKLNWKYRKELRATIHTGYIGSLALFKIFGKRGNYSIRTYLHGLPQKGYMPTEMHPIYRIVKDSVPRLLDAKKYCQDVLLPGVIDLLFDIKGGKK